MRARRFLVVACYLTAAGFSSGSLDANATVEVDRISFERASLPSLIDQAFPAKGWRGARRSMSSPLVRLTEGAAPPLPPFAPSPGSPFGRPPTANDGSAPLPPLAPAPAAGDRLGWCLDSAWYDVQVQKTTTVDQAIAVCDNALELYRSGPGIDISTLERASLALAELQLIKKNFSEALGRAASVRSGPDTFDRDLRGLARLLEVRALIGLRRGPDAERAASELLRRVPDPLETNTDREIAAYASVASAELSIMRGKPEKAISDFRKALTFKPTAPS
jgi:hypothetical protein